MRLPPRAREAIASQLTVDEKSVGRYAWDVWARPKQAPKTDTRVTMWMTGRGFGKTTSAANRIRRRIERGARSIALIGPTVGDVERWMIGLHGEEGLMHVFPAHQRPEYVTREQILLFKNGAVGYVNTAEKPELRGPNLDTVWCDELAKWRFLEAMWSNIELATRKAGPLPVEILVTTTPRSLQFLKELVADPDTTTILGHTRENEANVDARWVARMERQIGGTRLGRQELEGEILEDNPDALFKSSEIDLTRVASAPRTLRIVISVDPSFGDDRGNDDAGVLVIGIDDVDRHLYVLEDLSGRHKEEEWARLAVDAYLRWGASAFVVENNYGGRAAKSQIRAAMTIRKGELAGVSAQIVDVTARDGKAVRAAPVSALYTNGFVHVVGTLTKFETEITEWTPGKKSPGRLDALVWGVTHLANLSSDEERPDFKASMQGLAQVTEKLRAGAGATTPQQRAQVPSAPSAARPTPRARWSRTL